MTKEKSEFQKLVEDDIANLEVVATGRMVTLRKGRRSVELSLDEIKSLPALAEEAVEAGKARWVEEQRAKSNN